MSLTQLSVVRMAQLLSVSAALVRPWLYNFGYALIFMLPLTSLIVYLHANAMLNRLQDEKISNVSL